MPQNLPQIRLPRRVLTLTLLAALAATGVGTWHALRQPSHRELGCPPLRMPEGSRPLCKASPLADGPVSEQGSLKNSDQPCEEIADLIDNLERQAKRTERRQDVLRNLAAAYCIAGQRDDRPDQLARGLEHWLAAEERAGRDEPAWTREALRMCGELGVRCGEPTGTPQTTLANPSWPALAELAARGATAEAEALVRGNVAMAADELLTKGLLPTTAIPSEDPGRARRFVVDLLTRITDDKIWRDGLAGLEQAEQTPDSEASRALIAALVEVRDAEPNLQDRAKQLGAAAAELRRLGSLLWIHAEILAAKADFDSGDRRKAVARLHPLLQEPELTAQLWNAARIHLMLGFNLSLLGQLEAGLAQNQSALDVLARTQDSVTPWRSYATLGAVLGLLGRETQAWRAAAEYLKLVRAHPPSWLDGALGSAAGLALQSGLPHLAQRWQQEALDLPPLDPSDRVHALVQAAEIEIMLGAYENAEAWITQAEMILTQSDPASQPDEALIRVLEVRSAWLEPSDPVRAFSLLEEALTLAQLRDHAPFELRLRVRLAELSVRLGKNETAARLLQEATEQIEAMVGAALAQQGSGGEGLRTFVNLHRPTFERLVTLQLARGEDTSALRTAEQMRTREILGLLARSFSLPAAALTPGPASDVQAKLEPGTTLLSFAVLPDQTIAWIVRRNSLKAVPMDLGRRALRHAVDRLLRSAEHGGEPLRQELRELHRSLIEPLLSELEGTSHLGIVPDDALNAVPFAALLDRKTERYLVQDWTTASSPSLALEAFTRERARQLGAVAIEKTLLVSEPKLDARRHPNLPPLQASRQETEDLAAIYPGAKVLHGKDATRSAITALLPEYQIFHFSGHSVTESDRSYLALAGEREDEARLDAQGLLGLDLRSVRLAVLASCASLGDRLNGAEGAHSLARPLLGAGVPGVVASLWEVPDSQTAALITAFHRVFRRGQPAHEALREAQLQRLSSADPAARDPRAWGGFVLVGWAEASSPP